MLVDKIVYAPTSEPAARALISSGAYKILSCDEMAPENFFTWKSGIKAPVYNDCRVLQAHPAEAAIVSRSLVAAVEGLFPEAEVVIGMAEAGLYWSAVTASGLSLPHAFIRKQKKRHGVGGMIVPGTEIKPNAKVVIVDDLMASGGTIEKAIGQIERECEADIIGVQTIVNWGFRAMRERFDKMSVKVHALTSYPQILAAAVEASVITDEAAGEFRAFYVDPKNHQWDMPCLMGNVDEDGKEAC